MTRDAAMLSPAAGVGAGTATFGGATVDATMVLPADFVGDGTATSGGATVAAVTVLPMLSARAGTLPMAETVAGVTVALGSDPPLMDPPSALRRPIHHPPAPVLDPCAVLV